LKLKPVLLSLLVVLCFATAHAQSGSVNFNPQPIDKTIKAKPYFKSGVLFQVEDVKFKNDTNYFTLYIINNSDKPLQLMTVEGKSTEGFKMFSIPQNFVPYKKILNLNAQYVTCGNSFVPKQLAVGSYIKQTISIACAKCAAENKTKARFTLTTPGEGNNIIETDYYSNAFDVYYDKETFDNYPLGKNLLVKKETIVSTSAKKVFPEATLGGYKPTTIKIDSLATLKPEILVYKGEDLWKEYEIQSCILLFVPKVGDIEVVHIKGGQFTEEQLAKIQKMGIGDRIIIDQIRAYLPDDGTRNLAPLVFTITE
jgi:hypothetical protein